MRRLKITATLIFVVGVLLISAGITLYSEESIQKISSTKIGGIDTKDISASASMVFKNENSSNSVSNANNSSDVLTKLTMRTSKASVIIPPRVEVYDNLTMEELADKLNRNLGHDYIAGKGYLIATECLARGVDPYIAVAIMLHETGCKSTCSSLTRTCNNVGGQKGAPGCNGGSYKAFATLDEGIVGFISNLEKNYFKVGLTTIDTIGPRYAESNTWPQKIHWYVDQIRAS